jgi:hypothetical protein
LLTLLPDPIRFVEVRTLHPSSCPQIIKQEPTILIFSGAMLWHVRGLGEVVDCFR